MRMWMQPANIMCRNHLLGEHNEIHKLIGHLKRKKKIDGWINSNCLEPSSIIQRHNELVNEMLKRGYKHQSEIEMVDISYLPIYQQVFKINRESSKKDLLARCSKCKGD